MDPTPGTCREILLRESLESPPVPDSLSKPFPFFDLPYDVAFQILRDYVPVEEKVRLRTHLANLFSPYLELRSCWFLATHRLFQLSRLLRPGWHVRPSFGSRRLHVTVDYEHLFFMIQYFEFHVLPKPLSLRVMEPVPWTWLYRKVMRARSTYSLHEDLLHYEYNPLRPPSAAFWIRPRAHIVHWSRYHKEVAFENNRCVLKKGEQVFFLELRDDFELAVEFREGSWLERALLSPRRYEASVVGPPPFPKTLSRDWNWKVTHPCHIEIFRNVHRVDSPWMWYTV